MSALHWEAELLPCRGPAPHVKATVCLLQEFDDPRDAEDAVYELDGKELCNERVTIEHARVRLRAGRGRGGGGGGGGGGRFNDRYSRGSQNSRSRNPPPMRTENRLVVKNLSSRVSWQVGVFSFSTSLSSAAQSGF
uniref:Serine and arginine rich splicing factor 5b n=1 Tax=Oryzias sinensis TaxID=183150 RepID=A0A8C8DGT9_9TELE